MALVIFDLDGTLIESYQGLGKAINKTLESLDCPTHSYEKCRSFIGAGIKNLVYQALPADKKNLHEEALKMMYKNYQDCYDFALEPYPNIENCLSELATKGHKLAVASNKIDYMTKDIVKRYFAKHDFVLVLGASDEHRRKPDSHMIDMCIDAAGVLKKDTILVGDSNFDILTAKNAGIKSIYVSWGFRTWEQVKENEPTYRADKAMDIVKILDEMR